MHKDKIFVIYLSLGLILKDSSSGCINRTTIEVFDEAVGDPWWKHAVNGYGKLTKEELPYGYKDGYNIEGMVIDTSIYMDYLLEMFKRLGGQLVQRKVKDIQEPFEEYEIVVNCTGLDSRDLFDDEKIYPVRGQTVKVKPNGSELVIDNYGHGGAGFTLSWGCAQNVVEIIEKL